MLVRSVDCISIHSLRMEGDTTSNTVRNIATHFNPLPPHGGRLFFWYSVPSSPYISIHSLRMEGDLTDIFRGSNYFIYFNPLPPHGGRPRYFSARSVGIVISIHSLRMEGDSLRISSSAPSFTFQSTPSAWRETSGHSGLRAHDNISIHSLRMEGDSKTAQESVFHFAYPCTILQKRMQKTTFCTRKNGFFRKKGEKFGAKPSASFCAPMIRTDTFPLNFSHRISGSSMSMVSFAPICSTFD